MNLKEKELKILYSQLKQKEEEQIRKHEELTLKEGQIKRKTKREQQWECL